MKLTLIFLELLKIISDNFLSKVTKAHAPFSIVFWFMPNLKAKIKITKSVPEYYLAPHFIVLQMSYFILFYSTLFCFIFCYFLKCAFCILQITTLIRCPY